MRAQRQKTGPCLADERSVEDLRVAAQVPFCLVSEILQFAGLFLVLQGQHSLSPVFIKVTW